MDISARMVILPYGENWKPLIQDSIMPIRLVLGEHDRNTQWGAARAWGEHARQYRATCAPRQRIYGATSTPRPILKLAKTGLRRHVAVNVSVILADDEYPRRTLKIIETLTQSVTHRIIDLMFR